MTDEQRLSHQIKHLMGLCAPPYTRAWAPYCQAKADAMAAKEPRVFATLPALLSEGLTSLRKDTSTAASTAEPGRRE